MLVVPNTVRLAINGTYGAGSVPVTNVIDVFVSDPTGPLGRDDLVDIMVQAASDSWQDDVLEQQMSVYTYTGLDWVDMDTDAGRTGHVAADVGKDLIGQITTAATSPAVSVLVTKEVASIRGARNGRLFQPGCDEASVTSAGVLGSGYRGDIETAYEAWRSAVTADVPGVSSVHPVVVHITAFDAPVPPHTTPTPAEGVGRKITSFVCEPIVATQRRRQRR